jgi:hypothetical protein
MSSPSDLKGLMCMSYSVCSRQWACMYAPAGRDAAPAQAAHAVSKTPAGTGRLAPGPPPRPAPATSRGADLSQQTASSHPPPNHPHPHRTRGGHGHHVLGVVPVHIGGGVAVGQQPLGQRAPQVRLLAGLGQPHLGVFRGRGAAGRGDVSWLGPGSAVQIAAGRAPPLTTPPAAPLSRLAAPPQRPLTASTSASSSSMPSGCCMPRAAPPLADAPAPVLLAAALLLDAALAPPLSAASAGWCSGQWAPTLHCPFLAHDGQI